MINRGVVLYGMTIGRLPFLCPRDEWTSSEERRRRLMIQINRGLTSIQEKAMCQTSIECRNLINRLLVPLARERITIREILDHPWILASSKNNLCFEDNLKISDHLAVIIYKIFHNKKIPKRLHRKYMMHYLSLNTILFLICIFYF